MIRASPLLAYADEEFKLKVDDQEGKNLQTTLDKINEAIGKLAEQTKKANEQSEKFKKNIGGLNTAIDGLNAATSTLRNFPSQVSQIIGELKTLQKVFSDTGSSAERAGEATGRTFTRTREQVRDFTRLFSEANRQVKEFGFPQQVPSATPGAIPSQATLREITNFSTAFNRASDAIKNTTIDAQRLDQIILSVSNREQVVGQNIKEANIIAKLARAIEAYDNLGKASKKAADQQVADSNRLNTALANERVQTFRAGRNESLLAQAGQLLPANAPTNVVTSFNNALIGLQKSLSGVAGSRSEIESLFDKLRTSPNDALNILKQYPPELQKVAQAFLNLNNVVDRFNASQLKISQKESLNQLKVFQEGVAASISQQRQQNTISPFIQQVAQSFTIPTDASVSAIAPFRAALISLQREVSKTNLPLSELNKLFAQARQDPVAFATALNTLDPALAKIANSMLRVVASGQSLQESLKKTGQEGQEAGFKIGITWEGVLRIFIGRTIQAALLNIQQAFTSTFLEAAKFQVQISQIRTLSQETQLSFETWRQSIQALAVEFGRPGPEIATAAYEAVSNQVVRGAQAFEFLRTTLNLANATNSSVAASSNTLASVINSFRISTNDADQVAARLFRTVDLGRVRLEDIQSTFGRTLVSAQQLGVSEQEVEAALATLTITGVRADTALTLLNNLFIKLIRPTEEMQKLFTSLGFSTGQTAVGALRLQGILQVLNDEVARGVNIIGAETGELRAMQAAFGLTGAQGQVFNNALASINNSSQSFANAINIIQESSGKQLLNFFNTIKTEFLNLGNSLVQLGGGLLRAGQTITSSLQPLLSKLPSFSTTINVLTTALISLGVAVLAVKAGLIALPSILAFITSEATGATAASQRLAAAFSAKNITVAALTAVLFLYFSQLQKVQAAQDELTQGVSRFETAANRATEVFSREQNQRLGQQQQEVTETNRRLFAGLLEQTRQTVRSTEERVQVSRQASKDISESFKEQFDTYIRGLEETVRQTRENLRQLADSIRQSQRQLEQLRTRASERIFAKTLSLESDPTRATALIDRRIESLKRQAQDIFTQAANAPNAALAETLAQSARQRIEEAIRLEDERLNRRLTVDEQLARTGRLALQTTVDETGQRRRTLDVSDRLLETSRRENQTIALSTQLEANFQRSREQSVRVGERSLNQEQERINRLRALERELVNLKPTTDTGAIREEFRVREGPNRGQFDPAAFRRRAQQLEQEILRVAGPAQRQANESDEAFRQRQQALQSLTTLLSQRRLALEIQSGDEVRAIQARNLQEQIVQERNAAEELIRITRTKIDTILAEESRRAVGVQNTLQQLENSITAGIGAPLGVLNTIDDAFRRAAQATGLPSRERLTVNTIREEIQAAIALAGQLQAQLRSNQNIDPAQQRNLEDRISRIFANFQRIRSTVAQLQENDPARILIEGQIRNLETLRTQTINQADFLGGQQRLREAQAGFQVVQATLNTTINNLQQQFNNLGVQLNTNVNNLTQRQVSFNTELQVNLTTHINRLELLVQNITTLNTQLRNLPPIQPVAPPVPAPLIAPPRFALGGTIDTELIRAARGEIVINPLASQKFFSKLIGVNNNSIQGFSSGGQVNNTNVGDVNISVQGGQTADATIREIAAKINREIRRGTIRFN